MMKKLPWLHMVLFAFTVLTTLAAGALYVGVDLIKEPWGLYKGIPFSFSIILILLIHEFSHYFASRMNHTKATLPYFIPAPTIIGTLGAVIKMKSPILTRKALVDIGASGPIGGFVVSVVVAAVGLGFSEVGPMEAADGDINLFLGTSLLFYGISSLIHGAIPAGYGIDLHAVAFAGWVGLFITSLNLIPIGQLDGGHIAYAFMGPRHRRLSFALVGVLVVLGILFWEGWLLWALIMMFIGLRHPPVMYWERRLDPLRRRMGIASFVIFIITFTPAPFIVAG